MYNYIGPKITKNIHEILELVFSFYQIKSGRPVVRFIRINKHLKKSKLATANGSALRRQFKCRVRFLIGELPVKLQSSEHVFPGNLYAQALIIDVTK